MVAKNSDTEPEASTVSEYVVTVDALVARVGKEKDAVTRFRRGLVIKLDSELVDIENLLRLKAIAPNTGDPLKRTNARMLAQAAGAADDPAIVPVSDVLPVQATAEQAADAQ
jgi:hypothetical protein